MPATHGETHEFRAEIRKLLDIITHSIYTNREIFLRELVSNASDALDKLRFEQSRGTTVADPDAPLEIRITADKEAGRITIAARSPMEILPLPGKGVHIKTPRGLPRRETKLRRVFAAGRATCSASDFLTRYAKDLRNLPRPRDPAISYLGSLTAQERDLWTTLLPSASAFQREAGHGGMDAASLLEATRSWAVETVEEAISEERKFNDP